MVPTVLASKQTAAAVVVPAKKATKAKAALTTASLSKVGSASHSTDSPTSLKLVESMIDHAFADAFELLK